jgi:trehalose 6-phosphate phosphatase
LENLNIDDVCAARRGAGLVAVFDFDGTLVNIARDPEAVHAPPKIGARMEALARRADTTVGIVSGRPLDHLLHMVETPDVWLFGLHGWEHRAPGGPVVRGWPPSALDVALRQRALLRQRLGPAQGERIEDKGPIIAVHTRAANPERRAFVERIVLEARMPGFALIVGRRVLELRPVDAPTKGHAVRTIAESRPGAPILYIGDDTTDEDAFAVLGDDDFAVLVDDEHAHAERPPTAVAHARYAVSGTDDVARIIRILGNEASCPV